MADNPYFKKPPVKQHHSALPQADVPDLVAKLKVRGEEQLPELPTIAGLFSGVVHRPARHRDKSSPVARNRSGAKTVGRPGV